MKYQIWTKGRDSMGLVKTYPTKIQAYIWCWLHGYVIYARRRYYLNGQVEIVRVEDGRK